jgi:hypothetical protein
MQNINDIIFNITGISLGSTETSELSLQKGKEQNTGVFFAQSRASVINMVCNTLGSLDNLVDFALLNNLSLTEINNNSKKVLFLLNKISDYSVLNKITSKKMNFITEFSLVQSSESGYLLQENGKYLLQENLFKIKL